MARPRLADGRRLGRHLPQGLRDDVLLRRLELPDGSSAVASGHLPRALQRAPFRRPDRDLQAASSRSGSIGRAVPRSPARFHRSASPALRLRAPSGRLLARRVVARSRLFLGSGWHDLLVPFQISFLARLQPCSGPCCSRIVEAGGRRGHRGARRTVAGKAPASAFRSPPAVLAETALRETACGGSGCRSRRSRSTCSGTSSTGTVPRAPRRRSGRSTTSSGTTSRSSRPMRSRRRRARSRASQDVDRVGQAGRGARCDRPRLVASQTDSGHR